MNDNFVLLILLYDSKDWKQCKKKIDASASKLEEQIMKMDASFLKV